VPGGIHYLLWPSFARAAGIDANKVQILNTDFRFNYQQLMAGQFDGINWVIHGAGEAQLEEQGKPMAGFLFADYVPLMGHGLVVPDKMIAERPAVVKAFVGATMRAWEYLAREPEKAVTEAATVVNQSVEKAPPAAMLSRIALKAVPTFMRSSATAGKPIGWSSPKEWQDMIDLLAELDKFPRKPEVAQVMTNQFVE
jgi:NitT/TauT family transport system substrate-binding protein